MGNGGVNKKKVWEKWADTKTPTFLKNQKVGIIKKSWHVVGKQNNRSFSKSGHAKKMG